MKPQNSLLYFFILQSNISHYLPLVFQSSSLCCNFTFHILKKYEQDYIMKRLTNETQTQQFLNLLVIFQCSKKQVPWFYQHPLELVQERLVDTQNQLFLFSAYQHKPVQKKRQKCLNTDCCFDFPLVSSWQQIGKLQLTILSILDLEGSRASMVK